MSLSGKKSCAGHVRIRNGDQIYWLSGSNSTWNSASANAVCRQLHCGRASKHSSINPKKDIWKKSYNCTSNATSLFNCDIATLASDHSNSTAHVTCEGEKFLSCLENDHDRNWCRTIPVGQVCVCCLMQ